MKFSRLNILLFVLLLITLYAYNANACDTCSTSVAPVARFIQPGGFSTHFVPLDPPNIYTMCLSQMSSNNPQGPIVDAIDIDTCDGYSTADTIRTSFSYPKGWTVQPVIPRTNTFNNEGEPLGEGEAFGDSQTNYVRIDPALDVKPGTYVINVNVWDVAEHSGCGDESITIPLVIRIIDDKCILPDPALISGGCSSCSSGSPSGCNDQLILNQCATMWKSPCCKCYFFSKDSQGIWTCSTDPTVRLSVSASVATVTLSTGESYTYNVGPNNNAAVGVFSSATYQDAQGRITNNYYDDLGGLESTASYDGRVTTYQHIDANSVWHNEPTAIIYPGETVPSIVKEYDIIKNHGYDKPTTVRIQNPDNTSEYSETHYEYYDNGDQKSVTTNSNFQTRYEYYSTGTHARDTHWVYTLNEQDVNTEHTIGTLYSQTEYSYNDNATLDYDSQQYGLLTVHEYKNANKAILAFNVDGTITSVQTNTGDRIKETYYYKDRNWKYSLPRAEKVKIGTTLLSMTVYDYYDSVDDSSNLMYGKVQNEKVIDIKSPQFAVKSQTSYEYYRPDTTYQIPHNTQNQDNQYYVTTPASVPYATGSDVNGNGEIRTTTVTIGATTLTTAYRYMIKSVGGVLTMTPITTITKDTEDHISKSVLNDDGSTAEVWQENESGTLEKIKSYTYYYTPDTHKGLVNTETVYNVASSGANRDMVTAYGYAFDSGNQTATAICGGRSTVSHYNALCQLDWSRDELNRQTDYEYDYQGRLVTTTYPAVDGVRKTTKNTYSCCHLENTEDENIHHTYYDYDGKGNVKDTYTNISSQSWDYPLLKYSFLGPFGAADKITTYSDSSHSRDIVYYYDAQERVRKIDYPGGLIGSEEFIYDEYDKLLLKKDGEGIITAYAYDDLDRLSAVDYDYAGQFQLPLTSFVEDVSYDYDGATSKVLGVTDALGTANYTHYRDGKIKTYTPAVPSGYGTISYEYNVLGQKTSMTVPLGVGNKGRKFVYTYDNTGRQTGTEVIPVTVTSSTSLETTTTSSQTRFYYDDDQNRVKLINKIGDVYYFVYDPTTSIHTVVYEQGPINRYLNIREPNGLLICRETYNSSAQRIMSRTYHFDGLGSTIALSDESGIVTDRYTYDAWGNLITHTGTTADNPYQYVGKHGYYTHYQESAFTLLQLGVRYYDSMTGRFAQRDALPTSYGAYTYASDAPSEAIDPSGYFCFAGEMIATSEEIVWDDTTNKQISYNKMTDKAHPDTCGGAHGCRLGKCYGNLGIDGESSIDVRGRQFVGQYLILKNEIHCVAELGINVDIVKIMKGHLAALAGNIPRIGGLISNLINNIDIAGTGKKVPLPPKVKKHSTRRISVKNIAWKFSVYK